MQNALILINYEVEVAGRLFASSCEQFSDSYFLGPSCEVIARFPKQHRAWQKPEVHKVFAEQMNELNEQTLKCK